MVFLLGKLKNNIVIILQTTLNSDLPGYVMARIRTDVYDSITGMHLLMPKGTKLLDVVPS